MYIKEQDKVMIYPLHNGPQFSGTVLSIDEVGLTVRDILNTVRFYPYTGIYYVELVKPKRSMRGFNKKTI